MKTFWRGLSIGLAFVAVLFIMHVFGLFDWVTLLYVQKAAYKMRVWSEIHTLLAPLLYMGIIVVSTAVFSPITVLATIVSGYLFGIVAGIFYTIFAVTIGGIIVVLLVRDGLGHMVQKKYRHHANSFNDELDRYGAYYVLVINLLPMTPTVILNILVGLSSMPVWSFAWATAVGIFPDTLIYVLIGEELLTLTSLEDLLSWQTIGLLAFLAFFVLTIMVLMRWLRIKKVVVPGDTTLN